MRVEVGLTAVHLGFQCFKACGQQAYFDLLGGGHAQLFRAAGFDQIVDGAGLHGIHRGVYCRVRSDDHHAHPRRLNAHALQHLDSVIVAQPQIEKTQIEHLPL